MDSSFGARMGGSRVEARERGHIVGRELVGVLIAKSDGYAIHRVHVVHHRKPRVVVGCCGRFAGDYIQVQLRPTQAKHIAQHSHQPVFHVSELRGLQRALSVDHDQSVQEISARAEVVHASINRVPEAFRSIAGAGAQQRVGHRAVVVVDDSDRGLRGGWGDIGGGGDDPFGVNSDVTSIDIFGKLAGGVCHHGGGRDRRPLQEGAGDEGIGGGVWQDRAQVPLIRVVV